MWTEFYEFADYQGTTFNKLNLFKNYTVIITENIETFHLYSDSVSEF